MIETIITGLTKDVVKSLGELAISEIARVLCVRVEINKLKRKLESMMCIIEDAEKTVVKYEMTRNWLKQLKEIVYEAENIIDRCWIEKERLRTSQPQECNPSSVFKCCRDVAFDCKIACDIRELNQKVESAALGKALLHLRPVTEDQTRLDRDVAPDLDPDIVGTEVKNDRDNLIQLLQRDDCPRLAIVGTVGVGKTTLAREIYHNTSDIFETRFWVHVSKDLKHLTIWSDGMFKKAETGEQQVLLHRYLVGRRFLLVIDDVWGESVWNELLERHEQHGTIGSRVLITTRDERVARKVGASHIHRVKRLNEDDGWWLLHTRALLAENRGNMQDIGRRIVQKCNGLPMAIRRIGCHLRNVDPREGAWERVYMSDFCGISRNIWNAINMSYQELPYYLKRCFIYCSLYPEEFVIERQYITKQWIAEGFITTQPNSTLEEEADKCYEELLERSILMAENEVCGSVGLKMPHLFRSFALLLSQDENFTGSPKEIGDTFKPYRLSITNRDEEPIPNEIKKLKSLRTLLLFRTPLNDKVLDAIFQKLTHLRVLDLGATQIKRVSGSLGRMVHLRYLSLADTQVRELPGSIENLMMLQFLILKNCTRLNSLPESVGRLINLRSLDISGTGLTHAPFRFSMMKELNSLQGFLPSPAGSENINGWPFQDLSTLSKLTSLQILRLERALNRENTSESVPSEKHNLKELELCCSINDQLVGMNRDAENIKVVFEALKPEPCLISLKLTNYYGHQFPSWLSVSALPRLQRLTLDGCLHCQLPSSLGQMKNLKFLAITGSNMLSAICPQLCGMADDMVAFPKLEQLHISKTCNLESWLGLEERNMPLLVNFKLEGCPKLNSLPHWLKHCMALTSLQIHRADSLEVIENLPVLKELEVQVSRKLKRIYNLERLVDLKVVHCSLLHVIRGVPSLRTLHLDERHATELPQWLQQQESSMLRRLEIVGTEELLDKCSSARAPYWPVIQRADHVYAKLPNDSFYFSYTKSTSGFQRSQRCLVRSLYNSASFTMPVVPETDPAVLKDEIRSTDKQITRPISMTWKEFLVFLLYVAAIFLVRQLSH